MHEALFEELFVYVDVVVVYYLLKLELTRNMNLPGSSDFCALQVVGILSHLAYPGESWRILAYPGVSILAYPGVSKRILAYPGVSWRILAYPGVSWRILA